MNEDHGGRSNGWVLIIPFVLLVAVFLLYVRSGTAAFAPPAPTPNLTATAVVLKPRIEAAALAGLRLRNRALACVCDPGLARAITGPALRTTRKRIDTLRTAVRHLFLRSQWTVEAVAVRGTAGSVRVRAHGVVTTFQGLVPIRRETAVTERRLDLRPVHGVWKVWRIRTHTLRRQVIALPSAPVTSARAVFIMNDRTGRTLYADRANRERLVASTAKMITALVAIRHLPLKEVVTVPAAAIVGGTTANLTVGERITVHDLFYGMLLPSGNDAATTLAIATSGSIPAFAVLMNEEAHALGLHHSHFVVPHGLDTPGQYSTARDLAWAAHALLRVPFLAGVVRTRSYVTRSADGRYTHSWTNLNQLYGIRCNWVCYALA